MLDKSEVGLAARQTELLSHFETKLWFIPAFSTRESKSVITREGLMLSKICVHFTLLSECDYLGGVEKQTDSHEYI